MSDSASRPPIFALVPAAGRGERFTAAQPKQALGVAGRPLLAWTLSRLLAADLHDITVALPADLLAAGTEVFSADERVRWIEGGDSRQGSVAACLAACPAAAQELLLVHDGARPLIAVEDIAATVEAARENGAAILGRPLGDTLKRLSGATIAATLDRAELFRAETPQVFRREILERAFELARRDGFEGTDEASLVERLPGVEIRAVSASRPNPKLTQATDLELIEALLQRESPGRSPG